jgi:hypothetical protein
MAAILCATPGAMTSAASAGRYPGDGGYISHVISCASSGRQFWRPACRSTRQDRIVLRLSKPSFDLLWNLATLAL